MYLRTVSEKRYILTKVLKRLLTFYMGHFVYNMHAIRFEHSKYLYECDLVFVYLHATLITLCSSSEAL